MGRGLSELQKGILKLACQNRQEALTAYAEAQAHPEEYAERVNTFATKYQWLELGVTRGAHVCPYHVLGEIYGFSEYTIRGWRGKRIDWCRLRDGRFGQKFARSEIGPARYDAATVATKKSLERLRDRGLLTKAGGARYRLTEAGLEVAEGLLAKNMAPG